MLSQKETDSAEAKVRPRIVVIGAGISGLTAAYKLTRETPDGQLRPEVLLLEASPRAGGTISTYNFDDVILELGPDSFITQKPAALELCRELGIEHRLINTRAQFRRTFIARNGELVPLPEGFFMVGPTNMGSLFGSKLFSWRGKLRMAIEPFIARRASSDDESIAKFVQRRFGKECLERAAEPLAAGIYTGNVDRLSMRSSFPKLHDMEAIYGSIVKGFSNQHPSKSHESGARYSLFVAPDEGMSVIINALVQQLPHGCLRTHTLVSQLRRTPDSHGWQLVLHDGQIIQADAVIIATAAHQAARILNAVPALKEQLLKIEHASSAVLNLIYQRKDVKHPLDGFGFVVPRTEKSSMLACSFSSVKWTNRVPEDKVLLRVFVGGTADPEIYDYSDEHIECLIWQDLNTYLGIEALPRLAVISRFHKGMPQYNLGHAEIISDIDKELCNIPGLALAGNAFGGVGIPDCVASGQRAASAVLATFSTQAKGETA